MHACVLSPPQGFFPSVVAFNPLIGIWGFVLGSAFIGWSQVRAVPPAAAALTRHLYPQPAPPDSGYRRCVATCWVRCVRGARHGDTMGCIDAEREALST